MPFTDIRASESARNKIVGTCYHCGQACDDTQFLVEDKQFCCYGCKTVYEILQDNNLCEYYSYESNPGVRVEDKFDESFAYLDDDQVKSKLILFEINGISRVQLSVPSILAVGEFKQAQFRHFEIRSELRKENSSN
jgi:Cu+-exporting ATPase